MVTYTRLLRNKQSFTATTNLINLIPGRYIEKLNLHLEADMTAASAKTPVQIAALVNPFEVRLGGSPIVQLRLMDLWAFNNLFLGKNPITVAATAATDSTSKIMGVEVPLWIPPKELGQVTCRAVYSSVSGVDTEKLTIAEISYDEVKKPGYLHYVEMAGTTSASTGFGNRTELPQPGDLIGIMFYSTTIPTATAETATVQEVDIYVDGKKVISRSWEEMKADSNTGGNSASFASPGDATHVDNYSLIDLRDEPIAKDSEVVVDVNGGVASEAYRIIPIYLVK